MQVEIPYHRGFFFCGEIMSLQSRVRMVFELPERVRELAGLFGDEHPLYLVGGAVRDLLLGETPGDWDFTTKAAPSEIKGLVRGWADGLWTAGERFGTIGVIKEEVKYEITTFRAESYEPGSRKPQVEFSETVEEDLSRRDFTINAVAYAIADEELVDPFGGLRDLQDRLLRTPGGVEQSFTDDPLRMLRALDFYANLRCRLSSEVQEGLATFGHLIKQISSERIRDELCDILLAEKPSGALRLLHRTGLGRHFLPEFSALEIPQPGGYHHKNVLEHTLQVVENCSAVLPLRLAALLHDIGKPRTRDVVEGEVHFYQHEVVGAAMTERILKRLKFSRKTVSMVSELVRMHLRPHSYMESVWSDRAVRRYIRDAGEILTLLNELATADVTTMNPKVAARAVVKQRELERRIERFLEEEDIRLMKPMLDGHQLMEAFGLQPGPAIGRIQKALLQAQIDGDLTSEEQAWDLARKMYHAMEESGQV